MSVALTQVSLLYRGDHAKQVHQVRNDRFYGRLPATPLGKRTERDGPLGLPRAVSKLLTYLLT